MGVLRRPAVEEWGQSQGVGFGHQGQGLDVFEQGGEIGQQRAQQQGFGPSPPLPIDPPPLPTHQTPLPNLRTCINRIHGRFTDQTHVRQGQSAALNKKDPFPIQKLDNIVNMIDADIDARRRENRNKATRPCLVEVYGLQRVPNADLAAIFGSSITWINERLGAGQRKQGPNRGHSRSARQNIRAWVRNGQRARVAEELAADIANAIPAPNFSIRTFDWDGREENLPENGRVQVVRAAER